MNKKQSMGMAIRYQTTCQVWPNFELIGMAINYV
jgi:hypothetical protein